MNLWSAWLGTGNNCAFLKSLETLPYRENVSSQNLQHSTKVPFWSTKLKFSPSHMVSILEWVWLSSEAYKRERERGGWCLNSICACDVFYK